MLRDSLRTLLVTLAMGLIAIFIQSVVLKSFSASLIVPNLIVILIVFLAFHKSSISGVILCFLLGLELDLFSSPGLLGPYAASSVAIFALVSAISRRLFLESLVTVFIAVFISVLAYEIFYFVIVSEFVVLEISFTDYLRTGLIEALASAVLAPILFRLLSGIRFSGELRTALV